MVPLKALLKDLYRREGFRILASVEPPLKKEESDPDLNNNAHPEIEDLLGCFCVQTGSQFG